MRLSLYVPDALWLRARETYRIAGNSRLVQAALECLVADGRPGYLEGPPPAAGPRRSAAGWWRRCATASRPAPRSSARRSTSSRCEAERARPRRALGEGAGAARGDRTVSARAAGPPAPGGAVPAPLRR